MAINKVNINGVEYSIQGGNGCTSKYIPTPELLYYSWQYRQGDFADRLFVKCNHGDIMPTDTVKFARYITGSGRITDRDYNIKLRYRYKGWKSPKQYDIVGKVELVESTNDYDIWEIVPDCYDCSTWSELAEYVYNGIPFNFEKKCGLALYRDGIKISDYIHFKLNRAELKWYIGRW